MLRRYSQPHVGAETGHVEIKVVLKLYWEQSLVDEIIANVEQTWDINEGVFQRTDAVFIQNELRSDTVDGLFGNIYLRESDSKYIF